MAKDEQPDKVGMIQRFKQIGTVVSFTAKGDKKFVPYAVGAAAAPLVVLVLALLLGHWSLVSTILWVVTMLFAALAGFLAVLNVRSNNAWLKMAEETPGSSAQVIENIPRGDFRVSPAVSATTAGEMVHLVIGRKGVILVGEGPNPAKVRQMIGQEKRRLAKVIGSAQMSDIIIGHGEGEVPMKKLQRTLRTMPNVISPKDVNALDVRLKALTARPQMPKGAIPKNMRPPTGAFRAPRGR
ncbi:MAG TPA: DUF4191 family protein [Micromonosporaceae bacterium]|jgi:hypothetical protein